MLVPDCHLLQEIESTIDFSEIYGTVEHLCGEDKSRPAVKPVVPVNMVPLQHLYGIKSPWQTARVQDEQLREEINLDRADYNKMPLKQRAVPATEKAVTV